MYKYIHLISFVRVCLCVFVCVCVCLHMCMFMHVPGGSLGWAELAHDIALLLALLISFIRCLFVKNANLHAYIAFCMILFCVFVLKVILVLLGTTTL